MVNLDHFTQVSRSTQNKTKKIVETSTCISIIHIYIYIPYVDPRLPAKLLKIVHVTCGMFFGKPYKLKLNFDDMSIFNWWLWGVYTPETNSSPLKMDGWKWNCFLARAIFRGKLLDSGRVYSSFLRKTPRDTPLACWRSHWMSTWESSGAEDLNMVSWGTSGAQRQPPHKKQPGLFEESWRDHGH